MHGSIGGRWPNRCDRTGGNDEKAEAERLLPGHRASQRPTSPAIALALRRLMRADYISAVEMRNGSGGPIRYLQIELAERGLRATGAWPADECSTSCNTS